ncbi:CidA/LrgA family protein [Pectobacterium betavasculorum]|uniref:CidA/LrgA family protein n=1 Tax=Pectobacterium betavasculorum TaxID=55207 RepID=UPI00313C0F27
MKTFLILFLHQARAFLLIYACLYLGIGLSALLPITLPGSIIGMLILFLLLSLQIIPAPWVKPGCHQLIRYMALLFVPVGVGVMQYFDLLRAQFAPVVVSCAVSTLVVLITVSACSHLVHRRQSPHHPTKTQKGIDHAL